MYIEVYLKCNLLLSEKMADHKGEEPDKEEVVANLNNHDVNNHDVNNHCAVELKEDHANHAENNEAIKEAVGENNHFAMVPNSSEEVLRTVCSDSLMVKNVSNPIDAPDEQPDSTTSTSNISESQKDGLFCQNDSVSQDDSGVKVDIESDIVDSSKDITSHLQRRTDISASDRVDSEMVDKTADKLDSDCSIIPIPDPSLDPHQHSDCSSSSRSSKDVFMDAQEDISNDSCKHMGEADVSMSKKDDSGIDIEKSPKKSNLSASANSPSEAGSSEKSLNKMSEELDDFYSSLPPGTSKRDNSSVADAFVVDFDTSSDTGNKY